MNDGMPTRVPISPLMRADHGAERDDTDHGEPGIDPEHDHQEAHDHGEKAEHRADRKIDLAGDQEVRHAHRDDADQRGVAQDVDQVELGQEGIGGEREEREDEQPPPG